MLDKVEFNALMDSYYLERGWDPQTTRPSEEKLRQLKLEFTGLALQDVKR